MTKPPIPMPLNVTEKLKKRFWKRVGFTANPKSCWEWRSNLDKDGYGRFFFLKKVTYRTHRLSYYLHYGVDPKENVVMHSCDNPKCCNPNHLSLGTYKENVHDMIGKGRENYQVGEINHRAKLRSEDVVSIRRRYAGGEVGAAIAREYGVDQSCVSNIVRRRNWKHL